MDKTLLQTGSAGFAVRFLRKNPARAFAISLGLALSVMLLAAATVLDASLQGVVQNLGRQGFGQYDLTVRQTEGFLTNETLRAAAFTEGIDWTVGVLIIDAPERATAGDLQYIGIGDFRLKDRAYLLAEGRYPGPGEFVARAETAQRLGLKVGQSVTLPFKTGPAAVRLAGIRADTLLEEGELPDALIFNLHWLQAQADRPDELSRLLVGAVPGAHLPEVAGNMQMATRHRDLVIQQRTELDWAKTAMPTLRGFAIVFGCLAFVTALYLLAGTFDIAVHERLPQLAMLRAIGATPGQVNRLLLLETALLSLLGSVAGLLAGIGLSRLALARAAAGLGIPAGPLVVPWTLLGVEAAAAVLLALQVTRKPARAAGKLPPLVVMRPETYQPLRPSRRDGRAGLWLIGLGVVLAPLGLLTDHLSPLRLVAVLGGALFIIGLLVAMPRILSGLVAILAGPLRALFPVETVMAVRAIGRYRRRNGMTVAAIALGIMLLTVIATDLSAAPLSDVLWKGRQFAADAVIDARLLGDLGHDLAGQVAAIPGVTAVVTRGTDTLGALVYYDFTRADPAWLAEVRSRPGVMEPERRTGIHRLDLPALQRLAQASGHGSPGVQIEGDPTAGLAVSADYARNLGLRIGDTIQFIPYENMRSRGGHDEVLTYTVTATVDGLPATIAGGFFLPRPSADVPDASIYFNYDPKAASTVVTAVTQLLKSPQYGMATFRDYAAEMRQSRLFSLQLTAVFGAAVSVIAIVCLLGLLHTIWAGLEARRRELALLRAVGATPAQIIRQVLLESLLLGLTGSLTGLLGGLAFLLSIVILDTAFPYYPLWLYLGCLAGGPLLAMLAGLVPALRVSHGTATAALRAE